MFVLKRFGYLFAEGAPAVARFNAVKYHWSEQRIPTILVVNQGSLDQVLPGNNRLLCSYDYKDMEGLAPVSNYPGGVAVIHGGFSRLV